MFKAMTRARMTGIVGGTLINIGSTITGFVVGKTVYDITDSMTAGVVVGATTDAVLSTVGGQVLGGVVSNMTLNELTADYFDEESEEVESK